MIPALSAVVVSLQEGEQLRLTIEQLRDTLPRDSEIVVVDDGSSDGSSDFLEAADARARLVRGGGLGVAGARNRGAAEARGDILLFVDAHMKLPSGWWEPLVELLGKSAGAAAPSVSDLTLTDLRGFGLRITGPELTSEWLPWQGCAAHPVPVVPGCSLAITRRVFRKAEDSMPE
jgi:glycosyltransferase involved in cell wall biosynthesis